MKTFTIITVLMLIIGGITTLTSFYMIAKGIADQATYDRVYVVAVISGIITIIGLVCVGVRVTILIYQHAHHQK